MAKEIDKFKKEIDPLMKGADKIVGDYARHQTNREHHKMMLLESAKEIGREVQKSKDNGVAGTELKDFLKEAGVLGVMKTVQNALGALNKEETLLHKMLGDGGKIVADLEKLGTKLDKEIDDRKKKKDRKLLAVDSKSLPDMEKLSAELWKNRQNLNDEVIMFEKSVPWAAKKERANFDKWVATEIGRTKSDRKGKDQSETDNRALDLRLVKKAVDLTKSNLNDGRTALAQAEKHFKNRELKEADQCIADAMKNLATIKKLHAPYAREVSKINSHDMKTMQGSKDGKYILTSVEQMGTVIEALTKLIKKTARASV
ncbi:MAG: hypothetical protein WD046_04360 [Paracoccaceae bacterium]